MKRSILARVAFRSLASRKNIYFPYLLALSFLFALDYILISLLGNDYVQQRHSLLTSLVGIGIFFTSLLAIIIALYASQFVRKAKQKELGLYTVLGLENKHIRFIMTIEHLFSWLCTVIASNLLGYSFGKIMFISLNRMMQDTGASFMDYPFDKFAALTILGLLTLCFLLIFLADSIRLQRISPASLLSTAKAGETEPKGKIWVALVGIITLAGGYYVALTAEGVMQSMGKIFLAIALVIIGTYGLFLSVSTLILKGLKKRKKYYYRPKQFLTISGMLYRMKANAVSLATIAILCSGIILTLSTTLTVYRGMEQQAKGSMPMDYAIGMKTKQSTGEADKRLEKALQYLQTKDAVSYSAILHQLVVPTQLTKTNELIKLPKNRRASKGKLVYLIVQTLKDYNQVMRSKETLQEKELLLTSNLIDINNYKQLKVAGTTYRTKKIDPSAIPSSYGVEVFYLVVADNEQLKAIQQKYPVFNPQTNKTTPGSIDPTAFFNSSASGAEWQTALKVAAQKYGVEIQSKKALQKELYSINGGLLFIGIIVSLVLLIGTILMLYFKQVTEGHADRENYLIMKKVGLPSDLIKKTIQSQIIWIFGLPLVTGLIHVMFASSIMSEILGLLGITKMSMYFTSYLLVGALFSVCYLVVYLLTSRAYYQIVDADETT